MNFSFQEIIQMFKHNNHNGKWQESQKKIKN